MDLCEILTAAEAAEFLKIGEKQLYRLCRLNRLRHTKVDGRGTIRTTRQWCLDYLTRASHGPLKEAA